MRSYCLPSSMKNGLNVDAGVAVEGQGPTRGRTRTWSALPFVNAPPGQATGTPALTVPGAGRVDFRAPGLPFMQRPQPRATGALHIQVTCLAVDWRKFKLWSDHYQQSWKYVWTRSWELLRFPLK